MRDRASNAIATLGLLSAAACGGAPQPGDGLVQRDSAGIRIVESLASSLEAVAWTLDTVPVMTVGVMEGDPNYLLSRVVGALRLPDGRVVIGNGGSNEVRLYDTGGRFLMASGREGEGPGEYQYMRGLSRCRESGFVVFDINWQINAYADDGSFVERSMPLAPDRISPYNLACDPQKNTVVLGWGYDEDGQRPLGFYQNHSPLVLTDRDGSILTDFGERLVSERMGIPGGSSPHPFGRATVFALHDAHLYVGSGERFEVEIWSLDGILRQVLRGPSVSLAIDESLRTAYLEHEIERAAPEAHPTVRRRVSEMEWPEDRAAYTELNVDPLGVTWLRHFALGRGSPERWALLDPERGYLGDLSLPLGHTLLEAGEDYLLVLTRDELDVERVVLLSLDRRGPETS